MLSVKAREAIVAAIVLVFVLVMAVFIATAKGIQIPVLSNLLRSLLGW